MNYIVRMIAGVFLIELLALLGWYYSSTEMQKGIVFFSTVVICIIYLNYLSFKIEKNVKND